jgi:hypothetical protein
LEIHKLVSTNLANLVEENIELKNLSNKALKMEILSTVGEGLADTEKEKLVEICESVNFDSKEDFTNHFYEMLSAFQDDRYTKINNKPLVGVYDARFSKCKEFIETWQNLAIKELGKELHFFTINWPKDWKHNDCERTSQQSSRYDRRRQG